MRKSTRNIVLLAASGLFAGVINGLLGAGGGIVAAFGLSSALSGHITDRRDAFANTLLVMLPLSALSLASYAIRGQLPIINTSALLLPAIAGGLCGALILDRINPQFLKIIFSIVVIYSGAVMLRR